MESEQGYRMTAKSYRLYPNATSERTQSSRGLPR